MIDASILIVDDHRLFAEVIALVLRQVGAHVLGPAETGAQAVATVSSERPDLVLLDLGLPDMDGFEAARQILVIDPRVAVVALTASTDARAPKKARRAGFRGYLPKDTRLPAVLEAIRRLLDGGSAVFPSGTMPGATHESSPESVLTSSLTDREHEVLRFIVHAAGSAEIARELGISTNTVRTHVQSILTKLQVHSRLEAAAFAIRHGLVEPGTRAADSSSRRDVSADVLQES